MLRWNILEDRKFKLRTNAKLAIPVLPGIFLPFAFEFARYGAVQSGGRASLRYQSFGSDSTDETLSS